MTASIASYLTTSGSEFPDGASLSANKVSIPSYKKQIHLMLMT
jgi:hypothetical protein